jgi:hypothetical protein
MKPIKKKNMGLSQYNLSTDFPLPSEGWGRRRRAACRVERIQIVED